MSLCTRRTEAEGPEQDRQFDVTLVGEKSLAPRHGLEQFSRGERRTAAVFSWSADPRIERFGFRVDVAGSYSVQSA